jgi:hypothetical protein
MITSVTTAGHFSIKECVPNGLHNTSMLIYTLQGAKKKSKEKELTMAHQTNSSRP